MPTSPQNHQDTPSASNKHRRNNINETYLPPNRTESKKIKQTYQSFHRMVLEKNS